MRKRWRYKYRKLAVAQVESSFVWFSNFLVRNEPGEHMEAVAVLSVGRIEIWRKDGNLAAFNYRSQAPTGPPTSTIRSAAFSFSPGANNHQQHSPVFLLVHPPPPPRLLYRFNPPRISRRLRSVPPRLPVSSPTRHSLRPSTRKSRHDQ